MSQDDINDESELLKVVLTNNLSEIENLIRRNARLLDYIYPRYNRAILLIACFEDGVEAHTVQQLIALGANCRDCRSDDGWEPIHYAAYKQNFEIMKILIKHCPECVNALDMHGNNALHFVIRYGDVNTENFKNCAYLLLNNGIYINQMNSKCKTPMDFIGEAPEEINNLFETFKHTNLRPDHEDFNKLKHYIYQKNEEKCIEEIDNINDSTLIQECYPIDSSTLLQMCCRHRLRDVVKHLLSKNVDPKKITNKDNETPEFIAANKGYWDILKMFLDKYDTVSDLPIDTLRDILLHIDSSNEDYKKCYNIFIQKFKKFNLEDYQVWLQMRKLINKPHECGNVVLHYAIWFADSEIIKELLSFGAFAGANGEFGTPINDIKAEIWKEHLDNCVTTKSFINTIDFQVTLNFQSLIPPYYENYKSSDSDITPTSKRNGTLGSDTEVIYAMTKMPELKQHMKHPVIVSFLTLKWQNYQWLFWINFAFYFIFAANFLLYISCKTGNLIDSTLLNILYYNLVISLIVFLVRESFQIYIDSFKYFKSIDNYAEAALIGTTFLILFETSFSHYTKQLLSFCVLLLSFELISVIGSHPYFSTEIVMLRTVSYNFFRSFFSYLLLIVAYAFSFHILFNNRSEKSEISSNATETLTEDEAFGNLGKSIFKTLVMLTGEFDSSSIDFDTFGAISKLIFLFFIFTIHLILLNLLNGLAVSDTQVIRDDAKILGHIARTEYIRKAERILKENSVMFNLINSIRNMFGCGPLNETLLLEDCKLIFLPRKNKFICRSKHFSNKCSVFGNLGLDKETIKELYNIIQSKRK